MNEGRPVFAQPYRGRWQIELFFKWIKQHLRIKAFYGTSLNASWHHACLLRLLGVPI